MIYTPENTKNMRLVDAAGKIIRMAKTFNDEMNEAEIYLTTEDGRIAMMDVIPKSDPNFVFERTPVLVKVVIPGAKMVPKKV